MTRRPAQGGGVRPLARARSLAEDGRCIEERITSYDSRLARLRVLLPALPPQRAQPLAQRDRRRKRRAIFEQRNVLRSCAEKG